MTAEFDAALQSVARGTHGDPFAVLGPHADGAGQTIRAILPDAIDVDIIDASGKTLASMERILPEGLYEARLSKPADRYRVRAAFPSGTVDLEDPYRFGTILTADELYRFRDGDHDALYALLGAHSATLDGVVGFTFAVWAPNAKRVSVVGEFNSWDGRRHPMRHRPEAGVWELFLPHVSKGDRYKFEIIGAQGHLLPLKSDPMAFQGEMRPSTASVAHGLPDAAWRDETWMGSRASATERDAPISIYEVHLGSWRRGQDGAFLTYEELADTLVPYVASMGFTHVEFLPISEHPFDGSWGYQPIGLYAPTARHGSPDAFAFLVNAFHEAGIGVLLDWVPGHFPTDVHGLGLFDGTHLYEHADPRQGFHQDWNTLIYNFGRSEVSNFLISNAKYWLDKFHIDGIRVDAVASMLYLDYSRKADEWVPNQFGGRENLEAIALLRGMNEVAYGSSEGIVTVAEESTAWPGVSQPTYLGGLGFGYKWNMGWMHDTLDYMSKEPVYRRYHHNEMTFGLVYAFSENFVLPLSHDEVVHGKGSMLGKMPGDRWQKFANLRAYYGFMWSHPGKKLLFMGSEFGQESEWAESRSLDWHHLDDPMHRGVQSLVRDLNGAYRDLTALHERDCEGAGFEWLEGGDAENSVLAYARRGKSDEDVAVVLCNFTPLVRPYRIGVPLPGYYAERINTDAGIYGGSNVGLMGGVQSEGLAWGGRAQSIEVTLPPLATLILRREASRA